MRGALATTLPAAPAAFALIYLHVLWRKRMAIAASTWYRTGKGGLAIHRGLLPAA
jgi:hypothetical protein